MKRFFTVAAAALALCVCLSACGARQGAEPDPTESAEITEPTFMTAPVDLRPATPTEAVPENAEMLRSDAEPLGELSALKREHYDNGTYYYLDATDDQKLRCFNSCYQTSIREGESETDYASRRAIGLSASLSPGTPYNLNVVENQELSDALGAPVYLVAYNTGSDLETVNWTVLLTRREHYSYQFAFAVSATEETPTDDDLVEFFGTLYFGDLPS